MTEPARPVPGPPRIFVFAATATEVAGTDDVSAPGAAPGDPGVAERLRSRQVSDHVPVLDEELRRLQRRLATIDHL